MLYADQLAGAEDYYQLSFGKEPIEGLWEIMQR